MAKDKISIYNKKVIDEYYSNGFNALGAICKVKGIKEPKDAKERKLLQTSFTNIKGNNPEYITKLETKNDKKYGNMRDKLVNKLGDVASTYEELINLALQDELTKEENEKFRRLRSVMSTKDYNKAVELIGKLTGSFEPVKKEITNSYTVSFGEAPKIKNNSDDNTIDAEYTEVD